MSGDYGRFQPIYGMSIVDTDVPGSISPLITAKAPNRIVTVQKIVFSPSVWTGTILSFLDSVTLIQIGSLSIPTVEPAVGDGNDMLFLDFGPTGTQLAPGSNLLMGGTGTGRLHIEAYQKGPLPGPLKYVAPMTAGFTA
jgi:hypothetical protein